MIRLAAHAFAWWALVGLAASGVAYLTFRAWGGL